MEVVNSENVIADILNVILVLFKELTSVLVEDEARDSTFTAMGGDVADLIDVVETIIESSG